VDLGGDVRCNMVIGRDGNCAVTLGESGGVGCSSGLIDRSIGGSLCCRLSGIVTCCGDSCRFPMVGGGCDSFQSGPPSQVNSSCFLNSGVVRMGAGRGAQRGSGVAGGRGSTSGASSFRFPVTGSA